MDVVLTSYHELKGSWITVTNYGIRIVFNSRDGKTVTQSAEYSSSFDGRIARLAISRMTEQKSGLYKCQVSP